ncbi:phosphatase [Streptomonospora algeriensis]|uniref:Phosphatase n=1 Tax=Streptomonospora algeriensis TaxID=995084 RepID=A0ABW3BEJ3_9ACTN
MPIRPTNLATMSATIAGALSGMRSDSDRSVRPVTVTFESGHRQVVDTGGCRALESDQGGVMSIEAEPAAKYALFIGDSCQGGRAVTSGRGSVTFSQPVLAGAIVLG